MAKIFKISTYVVDYTDMFDNNETFKNYLEYRTQHENIFFAHTQVESADIGEWHEDHLLNWRACPPEEYEKYFKENNNERMD